MKPLVRSSEGYRIARKASKSFLSERIRQTYIQKERLRSEGEEMKRDLNCTLSEEEFQSVHSMCDRSRLEAKEETKKRHIKKLEALLDKKKDRNSTEYNLRPEGLNNWVVNLTKRSLTQDQESVLRLGLNFTPTPQKLPLVDTMAGVELGAKKLEMDEADELRRKVCGVLKKAKLPRDNLTVSQRKALKELHEKNG